MGKYLNLEDRLYSGEGEYNIPKIEPVKDVEVSEWIGFNYVKSNKKETNDMGVSFFLDDYQFERAWMNPSRYTKYLLPFYAVLSPDFSLYSDFPKAVQIFRQTS